MKNDRQCFRKKSYFSHTEAFSVAEKCKRKRKVELRVYKCPNCLQYHLSHKPEIV